MDDLTVTDEYLHVAAKATEAAREVAADRSLADGYDSKHHLGALVTEADRRAEEQIREVVGETFPNHGFFGEEDGAVGNQEADARWIIDPIDGTTNYYHGLPPSASMVAVEVDDDIHACAIRFLSTGDLYYAVRGEGAYRNGDPIEVDGPATLSEALVAHEMTASVVHDESGFFEGEFERRKALLTHTHGVRKHRCAAYHGTRVAQGDYHAVLDRCLHPWDLAPIYLLIEEAGGRVTDYEGRDDWPTLVEEPTSCIGSNGDLHDALLDLVANPEP